MGRRLIAVVALLLAFFIDDASGFIVSVHKDITKESLDAAPSVMVYGKSEAFSDLAKMQIMQGNAATDCDYVQGAPCDFGFSAALYYPERHFTNEVFSGASGRIAALRADVIAKVTATVPDGPGARQSLGSALHTIQDYYAHSNWEELPGGSLPNSGVGFLALGNPNAAGTPCPISPTTLGANGGGSITSGYFNGLRGCSAVPANKCYHGNYVLPSYLGGCSGINKDEPINPLHATARANAKVSTEKFISSLLDDPALKGNDKALAALLDVKGDLAFVVDTTGSMGDEIELVKSAIQGLVLENAADPEVAPDQYLLVPFNDPTWGPTFATTDASTFQGLVGGLGAYGGGDCPELAWHGLLEAVQDSSPGTNLYFFSDADSKDDYLANATLALASKKETTMTFFNSGSCSPHDPSFIRAAAVTGGQYFFIRRSEMGVVGKFVRPQLQGHQSRIVSQQGAITAGTQLAVSVPVDTTMTRLTITAAVDGFSGVTVKRPSGVWLSQAILMSSLPNSAQEP